MSATDRSSINSGPGRVITALYAILAVAALGRSSVQILREFGEAPLAYGLSGVAAVLYVLATCALIMGDRAWSVAVIAVSIEMVGVLAVGALSYTRTELFPDQTVWSHFGQGYGFVPLILPAVGLWWLLKGSRTPPRAPRVEPDPPAEDPPTSRTHGSV